MHIFLSNYWWQESDIWSQASYRYAILWEAILDPSDSCFLFADLVGFYTHWTYMHIFLSNYWWQRSDIWSQASYRYPISWEAFFHPSDSYFLFAEERGYHKWALAHSSSCLNIKQMNNKHIQTTKTILFGTLGTLNWKQVMNETIPQINTNIYSVPRMVLWKFQIDM